MKKILLASVLLSLSMSSFAEVITPVSEIEMRDPITRQMQKLSPEDMTNAEKVMTYVAPIDGSHDLYKVYVANGYIPFHAMLLTNWDVTQGLRILAPNIPENPQLKARVTALKNQYKPAN
ncbi:hypothetical protein [Pseudomonas sp. PLMAX]|jgi:hypothetical protein|uniref:hypothetical protein n=1 Tax=Pseudomonas sp. PLMAX TaxID=2201998 RepID=UPI0038B7EA70